jgi:integrase
MPLRPSWSGLALARGQADPRTGEPKLYWVWPPNALRHHAATWMLKDLKLALPLVADYLGHVDSAFTERMYMDRGRTDFGPGTKPTRSGRAARRDRRNLTGAT